jgi:hypothetical protein|tara:strand:- start:207 stop:425 length:219 start_codon:yes stop_codon:yes gene_type:complete
MITRDSIEKRKEVLSEDINNVRLRLQEYEKKKVEDVALLNGLSGAFQQCEIFLKELDDDKPEMAGDDGNESS